MKGVNYKVTDITVSKTNDGYYVEWMYAGTPHWAQGEFLIDKDGYLHHSFLSPRGKEVEFKVKVR